MRDRTSGILKYPRASRIGRAGGCLAIVLALEVNCGTNPETAHQEAISCLRTLAGNSARSDVQGDALLALGRLKDASALPRMKAALGGSQEDVAFKAVQALEVVGGPEAMAALRECLKTDGNPFVKAQIVVSLHHLGDASGIPQVEAALGDSTDLLRRSSGASALGKVGDRAAIPRLSAMLLKDPEFMPRSSAAAGLGMLRDASALPALAQALREDSEPVVRISAVEAMTRIGGPEAVSLVEDALLNQTNYQVRKSLITALEDLKGGRAIFPTLRARFAQTGNTVERMLAAEALGRLGDREAIPVLKSVLQADADEVVRLGAGEALARLGEAQAMMAAVQGILVGHDNDSFQNRAAEILAAYGDESVQATFRRMIAWDGSPELRRLCARGLGRGADRSNIIPLEKALENDGDENVRITAAAGLGNIPHGAARRALSKALTAGNQTADVRIAAVRALRSQGDRAVLGDLVKALHDEDARVQLEAAFSVLQVAKGIDVEQKSVQNAER